MEVDSLLDAEGSDDEGLDERFIKVDDTYLIQDPFSKDIVDADTDDDQFVQGA